MSEGEGPSTGQWMDETTETPGVNSISEKNGHAESALREIDRTAVQRKAPKNKRGARRSSAAARGDQSCAAVTGRDRTAVGRNGHRTVKGKGLASRKKAPQHELDAQTTVDQLRELPAEVIKLHLQNRHQSTSGNKRALAERLWATLQGTTSPEASSEESPTCSSTEESEASSTSSDEHSDRQTHREKRTRKHSGRRAPTKRHHKMPEEEPKGRRSARSGHSHSGTHQHRRHTRAHRKHRTLSRHCYPHRRHKQDTRHSRPRSQPGDYMHHGRRERDSSPDNSSDSSSTSESSGHHRASTSGGTSGSSYRHSRYTGYLPAIPEKLRSIARRGEYVDLVALLPTNLMQAQTKRYDSRERRTQAQIRDFTGWLEAWSVYASCLVVFYPAAAQSLFCYQQFVASQSKRF